MFHTALFRYVVEKSSFCCRAGGNAKVAGRCCARATTFAGPSLAKARRLNTHGPSGKGCSWVVTVPCIAIAGIWTGERLVMLAAAA